MATSREHEQAKAYGRVVAKAWSDQAFEQRLHADPAEVLKAEGVAVPDGVEFRLVENTGKVVRLTLPAKPAELSDEQLDQVAGGMVATMFCSR